MGKRLRQDGRFVEEDRFVDLLFDFVAFELVQQTNISVRIKMVDLKPT